ncbi:MAG TPA: hypothetical protein VMV04_15805 [Thermodesulfobacteriota bacterium]|nr:hypothetical protein [Thermodesulfobacteriota bacterium]
MMKVKRLGIIVIYLLALSACQSGGKTAVPGDLIGVWETTAPAYADRFFEITTDRVIFATGENTSDTYPISKMKIEKDSKERKTLYIVCYKNTAGQEYKFAFYYDPANQGTIRFKNQREMVWTRKPLSSASEESETSAVVSEK